MKNRRKYTAIVLVIIIILTFSSCAEFTEGVKQGMKQAATGEISTGTWDEDAVIFTNEWSNIRFTKPEGFTAATQQEIDAVTQKGMEATGKEGLDTELALMRLKYDFMVTADNSEVPSMILMYENVDISSATKKLDEAGYLDVMSEQFKALEAQGVTYTEMERSTAEIAGQTWTLCKFSINDGVMLQSYYLRKVDGVMHQIILTYNDDTTANADSLLAAISTVN